MSIRKVVKMLFRTKLFSVAPALDGHVLSVSWEDMLGVLKQYNIPCTTRGDILSVSNSWISFDMTSEEVKQEVAIALKAHYGLSMVGEFNLCCTSTINLMDTSKIAFFIIFKKGGKGQGVSDVGLYGHSFRFDEYEARFEDAVNKTDEVLDLFDFRGDFEGSVREGEVDYFTLVGRVTFEACKKVFPLMTLEDFKHLGEALDSAESEDRAIYTYFMGNEVDCCVDYDEYSLAMDNMKDARHLQGVAYKYLDDKKTGSKGTVLQLVLDVV